MIAWLIIPLNSVLILTFKATNKNLKTILFY
jgi:hypothetical protein